MDIKRQYNEMEWFSEYLDNRLSIEEKSAFEKKLAGNEKLQASYGLLRATLSLIHRAPKRRAPHNFTISLQVASKIRKQIIVIPILRFSSVFSAALSIIIFAFSFLFNRQAINPSLFMAAAPMSEKSAASDTSTQPQIIIWGSPATGMGGGGGGAPDIQEFGKGGGGGAPQTMSAESLQIPTESFQPNVLPEGLAPTYTPEAFLPAAPIAPPENTPAPTTQPEMLLQPTPAADSQRLILPSEGNRSTTLPAITGSGPILGINPSESNSGVVDLATNGNPAGTRTNAIWLIAGSILLLIGAITGIATILIGRRKY